MENTIKLTTEHQGKSITSEVENQGSNFKYLVITETIKIKPDNPDHVTQCHIMIDKEENKLEIAGVEIAGIHLKLLAEFLQQLDNI